MSGKGGEAAGSALRGCKRGGENVWDPMPRAESSRRGGDAEPRGESESVGGSTGVAVTDGKGENGRGGEAMAGSSKKGRTDKEKESSKKVREEIATSEY